MFRNVIKNKIIKDGKKHTIKQSLKDLINELKDNYDQVSPSKMMDDSHASHDQMKNIFLYICRRKSVEFRNKQDLELMHNYMKNFQYYRQIYKLLNKKYRFKLVNKLLYQFSFADTTLMQKGVKIKKLFFIISGKVTIEDQNKQVIGELTENDTFGADLIQQNQNISKYNYICYEKCQLLVLHDDGFQNVMRQYSDECIGEKVNQIRQFQIFKNQEDAILRRLIKVMSLEQFQYNKYIFKNAYQSDQVYFIQEGSVQIIKQVQEQENLEKNVQNEIINQFKVNKVKQKKSLVLSTLYNLQFFGKLSDSKDDNDFAAKASSQNVSCFVVSYQNFKNIYINYNKQSMIQIQKQKLQHQQNHIENYYQNIKIKPKNQIRQSQTKKSEENQQELFTRIMKQPQEKNYLLEKILKQFKPKEKSTELLRSQLQNHKNMIQQQQGEVKDLIESSRNQMNMVAMVCKFNLHTKKDEIVENPSENNEQFNISCCRSQFSNLKAATLHDQNRPKRNSLRQDTLQSRRQTQNSPKRVSSARIDSRKIELEEMKSQLTTQNSQQKGMTLFQKYHSSKNQVKKLLI